MLLTRWITLRSLRTRPLRTLLSLFGIVLGVGGLLAIQITNLTAFESLSALLEGTAGKPEHRLDDIEADFENWAKDLDQFKMHG